MKYKVFVTRCDVPESALSLLKTLCDVEIWTEMKPLPHPEFLQKAKGKDGLFVTSYDRIDRELVQAAGEKLKVVATMSAGYDHVDVAELRKRGIKVGVSSGATNDAVAELTVALLLALTRRLFEGSRELERGNWKSWHPWTWLNGIGLKGTVIGIIGLGRIGLEVAKRLRCFKIKGILYTSRNAKDDAESVNAVKVDLQQLLQESDVVIVTCSLTEETRNMLGDKEFDMMKKTAVIVNTSRGGVIDQDALVRALREKKIAGAALDVMTPEPIPTNHELLKFPNCCLVPHIGSAETKTRIEMAEIAAMNIIAAFQGKEMPRELTE
ncbi:UNVERIFIED_CONTAM: hypothetical protein PYX00_009651 [Menopon gallinae]